MVHRLFTAVHQPPALIMRRNRSAYPTIVRASSTFIRPQDRRRVPRSISPSPQLTQSSGFETVNSQEVAAPTVAPVELKPTETEKVIKGKRIERQAASFARLRSLATTVRFGLELTKPRVQRSLESWQAREWFTERIIQPYPGEMDGLDDVVRDEKEGQGRNTQADGKAQKMMEVLLLVACIVGIEVAAAKYLNMFEKHTEKVEESANKEPIPTTPSDKEIRQLEWRMGRW